METINDEKKILDVTVEDAKPANFVDDSVDDYANDSFCHEVDDILRSSSALNPSDAERNDYPEDSFCGEIEEILVPPNSKLKTLDDSLIDESEGSLLMDQENKAIVKYLDAADKPERKLTRKEDMLRDSSISGELGIGLPSDINFSDAGVQDQGLSATSFSSSSNYSRFHTSPNLLNSGSVARYNSSVSPYRIPLNLSGIMIQQSISKSRLTPDIKRGMNVGKESAIMISSSTDGRQDDGKQDLQMNILISQIQALASVNEQLNEALERSEGLRIEEAEVASKEILRLKEAAGNEEALSRKVDKERNDLNRIFSISDAQSLEELTQEKQLLSKDNQQKAQTIVSMNEKIENLRFELSEKIKLLESKDEELLSTFRANDDLNAASKSFEKQVIELKKELNQREKERKVMEQQILKVSELESELLQTRQAVKSVEATEELSRLTIARLERLIKEQQLFIQDLTDRISHSEAMKAQLGDTHSQYLTATEELSKALIDKENIASEVVKLQAIIDSLKMELSTKSSQLSNSIELKTIALQEAREQLSKSNSMCDHLQSENSILMRRIEMLKENEQKISTDEDMVRRRLALEQQSHATQAKSFRQSIDSTKQTLEEMTARYQSLEEEHRAFVRDSSAKINELEAMVVMYKQMNHDVNSRLLLLESESGSLSESLQTERVSNKVSAERAAQNELKLLAEIKALQVRQQELQGKIEQLNTRLIQKNQEIKDLEAAQRQAQESLEYMSRDREDRSSSLQSLVDKYKTDLESLQEERRQERKQSDEVMRVKAGNVDELRMKVADLEKVVATLESEKHLLCQSHSSALIEAGNKALSLEAEIIMLHSKIAELATSLSIEKDVDIRFQSFIKAMESQFQSFAESVTVTSTASATIGAASSASISLSTSCAYDVAIPDHILRMKSFFDSLTSVYKSMHESLSHLEASKAEQVESLKRRLLSLEETLLQTAASWKETQQKLESSELVAAELRGELLDVKSKLTKVDFERQELFQQVSSSRQELSLALAREEIAAKSVAEAALASKLIEVDLTNALLREQQLQQDRQDLSLQVTRRSAELARIEENLRLTQAANAELESKLGTAEETVVGLETQLDAANSKSKELSRSYETMSKRLQVFEETSKARDVSHETAMREAEEATAAEKAKLWDQIREKETEMSALREELSTSKKSHETLTLAWQKADQTIKSLQEQLTKSLPRDSTEALMDDLKEKLGNALQTIEGLSSGSAELKREKSLLATELEERRQSLRDIRDLLPEPFVSVEDAVGAIRALAECFIGMRSYLHDSFSLIAKSTLSEPFSASKAEKSLEMRTFDLSKLDSLIHKNRRLRVSEQEDVAEHHRAYTACIETIWAEWSEERKETDDELSSLRDQAATLPSLRSQCSRYEEQVRVLQENKSQAEERYKQDVAALEKDLNQCFLDYELLQEEQSAHVQRLTRSYEEKLKHQLQSATATMNQRLSEQRIEDENSWCSRLHGVEDQYQALQADYESLRQRFIELEHISNEDRCAAEDSAQEIKRLRGEIAALEQKLKLKSDQIAHCNNQIQALEVEAAQETRDKLRLERALQKSIMKQNDLTVLPLPSPVPSKSRDQSMLQSTSTDCSFQTELSSSRRVLTGSENGLGQQRRSSSAVKQSRGGSAEYEAGHLAYKDQVQTLLRRKNGAPSNNSDDIWSRPAKAASAAAAEKSSSGSTRRQQSSPTRSVSTNTAYPSGKTLAVSASNKAAIKLRNELSQISPVRRVDHDRSVNNNNNNNSSSSSSRHDISGVGEELRLQDLLS